jgi:hypothetical protein
MNLFQGQQTWEMMRQRHAEMLQEAQREQLAHMAQQPKSGWMNHLFRRQAQKSTLVLNPSATPKMG